MPRFLSRFAIGIITFFIGFTAVALTGGAFQTTNRNYNCRFDLQTRSRSHCTLRMAPFVPPASLEAKPAIYYTPYNPQAVSTSPEDNAVTIKSR